LHSLARPAISLGLIGRHFLLTSVWILMVSPPRGRTQTSIRPPFWPSGLAGRLAYGSVDHLNVAAVNLDDGVHQSIPNAGLSPPVEATEGRGARPVALRQIRPRRPRPQHPENAVENPPIVNTRPAARLVRKMRFDRLPFPIAQLVAVHRPVPFGSLNHTQRDWRILTQRLVSVRPRVETSQAD
jgi:hypothetical protein